MWRVGPVLLGFVCTLAAQGIQLVPIADATTDELYSQQNFGADVQLRLGSQFSSIPWVIDLRGYLLFDISSVQGPGRPVRATLYWFQSSGQWTGGGREVSAFQVTGGWSEYGLTWANQPGDDGIAQGSQLVGAQTPSGWRSWDVTSVVQAWLDGRSPNHGIVLRNPLEAHFAPGGDFVVATGFGPSRESPTTANRPYLDLEFGTSFGTGCATAGAIPSLVFGGGAPRQGDDFILRTVGLPTGSHPTLLLGFSNSWWNGPLPWNLASIGFAACWLRVAPEVQIPFPPTMNNSFDRVFTVPVDPSLAGVWLYAQTAAVGPGGSFHMSNGFGFALR